ncbi:hypothetical protein [Amorphus orientalis]|uniref:Uncharacterized protein n=1 Tax=Amorphus orientalis TaxID=649198 RepID=A0AAE3VL90_9HYPH|nr:hypothetical protein [Amorphus orientalis]MDQ0314062.1 hypothetical protein [Amorphus orientalis]
MIAVAVLVFVLAALLGCSGFYLVRQVRRDMPGLLKPSKTLLALATVVFAGLLLATVAGFLFQLHPRIGGHFWYMYLFADSDIGYALYLGLLFGIAFGFWSAFLLVPPQTRDDIDIRAHDRWRTGLIVILVATFVAPAAGQVLDRITQIGSPTLGVSIAMAPSRQETRRELSSVLPAGTDTSEFRMSPLSRAHHYADSMIPLIPQTIRSDPFYIYLLTGKITHNQLFEASIDRNRNEQIGKCISHLVHLTSDPTEVHDAFGDLLHRLRHRLMDANGILDDGIGEWIFNPPAIHVTNAAARRKEAFGKLDAADAHTTRETCRRYAQGAFTRWPFRAQSVSTHAATSLYQTMLIAFALSTTGAHEAAIRTMAEWIKAATENGRDDDLSRDWALVRAKQYLYVSLASDEFEAASFKLLKDLLVDIERLLAASPYYPAGRFLSNQELWTSDTACRTLEGIESAFEEQDGKARSAWVELEAGGAAPFLPQQAAARLVLSYISFSNLYVMSAFSEDVLDASALGQARRNAALPDCFYKIALTNPQLAAPLRGKIHRIYGYILLQLAEKPGQLLHGATTSRKQAIREAFRQLSLAREHLELAQTIAESRAKRSSDKEEPPEWYRMVVRNEGDYKLEIDRLDSLIALVNDEIN